jgi:hypothetical protein
MSAEGVMAANAELNKVTDFSSYFIACFGWKG